MLYNTFYLVSTTSSTVLIMNNESRMNQSIYLSVTRIISNRIHDNHNSKNSPRMLIGQL